MEAQSSVKPVVLVTGSSGLIGARLIGFGFLASPPPAPPALQNHSVVGLLLLMFAIVPNEASLPR